MSYVYIRATVNWVYFFMSSPGVLLGLQLMPCMNNRTMQAVLVIRSCFYASFQTTAAELACRQQFATLPELNEFARRHVTVFGEAHTAVIQGFNICPVHSLSRLTPWAQRGLPILRHNGCGFIREVDCEKLHGRSKRRTTTVTALIVRITTTLTLRRPK